ncbi:MAG: tetratricopeptide repeat protein, partial [Bacteroidaceae bacterium]
FAMQKAVEKDPNNFWYKQTLAAFHQAKGDSKKAIAVFEEMAERFSARQEPLMMLIDLYNQQKDYPNVIRSLDRLEARSGKTEQISMEKFRIYLMTKNDKKAFQEIENLAKEYPNDMKYLSVLGDVYLNNGKTKEAYDTYKKVLSIEPDNAMALLSMASYYDKMGEKELYRQQIDTVLLNKKVEPGIKLNIMRQLIGQSEQTDGDSTKIIPLFDSMLKVDAEDAQMTMLYVQYLISKGMEKESIPILNKVLELDPANVPARLQLLSYAIKKNNYQEAIEICEPALEYSPETLEFYFYLGLAYFQAERKEDALKVYLKGIEQVDDKSNKNVVSDFYSMVGDIYYDKKMKMEAYAAYDSALVYNSNNVGAMNNYAYYLSVEKKDLDKAEETSYRTVKAEPTNGTFLDTYAWILFEKGKYTEAKIYIDNAMQNGGAESDVVVEHCGDIY